jgi:hypothetical protein
VLIDTQVKAAKKADKPYKMKDSGGLHLFVSTAGGKLWRYRYEFGGKEKGSFNRCLPWRSPV